MLGAMVGQSEVEMMVILGRAYSPHSAEGAAFEMALKRFEFEFPTAEARRAYVEAYRSHWTGPVEDGDDGVRAAFRFWFEYVWPNLPKIRNHPDFLAFKGSKGTPLFRTGQVVVHRYLDYRGVIVSIDRVYRGTDDWYESNARSLPPKNRPWYRVLVDGSEQVTYVAERHLESEPSPAPVEHPLLNEFFESFEEGRYSPQWRRDDSP